MKRLMISAHPEWVEKILNGEKTIEVRPWIPKGELPLEVLIYVTKGKPYLNSKNDIVFWLEQEDVLGESETTKKLNIGSYGLFKRLNGKVVGKFTLNKTYKLINVGGLGIANLDIKQPEFDEIIKKTCLSINQIGQYLKGKDGHAWKIDDLVIFYEPKELGEFYHYKKKLIDCGMDCPPYIDEVKVPLTKAPQKMVWVED